MAVLAFNCIRGTGPAYFKDGCIPLADIPGRASLRAAERGELFVPSTRTTIGGRVFGLQHHLSGTRYLNICMRMVLAYINSKMG